MVDVGQSVMTAIPMIPCALFIVTVYQLAPKKILGVCYLRTMKLAVWINIYGSPYYSDWRVGIDTKEANIDRGALGIT